jgi:schlafen family protein
MPTTAELQIFLEFPVEKLKVEYKSWLKLDENPGRATLAKAAIALANEGGGVIVLGMREDNARSGALRSQARPKDVARYSQDVINAAINRYADPQFHCELAFANHPGTNHEHAFVMVPGGMIVPVMSVRGCDGVIGAQKCYVRKPGPRSEEPFTSEEWRGVMERCIAARRESMLDAIRIIVQGHGSPAPISVATDRGSELGAGTGLLPEFPAEYALRRMSKKSAPVKATGGGGYTFADKVAAGFLVQMLRQKFPLEPELGSIAELHFETRDAGHVLDDLQLRLKSGMDVTGCLVSVKSNRQLTKAGFNKEFVQDAWEEWKGGTGSKFDSAKDILGLIVGVIDESTLHEWQELQKQAASTTPDRLSARLLNNGQSSATQRAIFESLRKSADGEVDAVETARIAARVRVLRFSDATENDYINLCAEIVRGGSLEDGAKLWDRLVHLASENRATGGYFDLPKLIRTLRPGFDLQDHPDFRPDWSRVETVSAENVLGVRSILGTAIQLPRADEKARLASEIAAHNVVVVAGESGSGKSAVISQLVAAGGSFQRTIWFSAEQLSKTSQTEIAQAFNLSHAIPELIKNSSVRDSVLAIDGFERFEGEARRRAIELARAVKEEGFEGWKVILICQPQSLASALDALTEAGIPDAHRVDFEKPKLGEILDAVQSIAALRPLLLRTELQPILRNLMVLDWVLREDIAQRFSASRPWIGETEVIDSIWERWAGPGSMTLARDSLLRTLGQREGEKLSGAVHIDSFSTTELPLLGEFAQQGLVRVNQPSVQFAHDLMGDWARYRILKFAGDDAPEKSKTVAQIPRWNRAIRLYAQSLAEHGGGLERWKAASVQLAGADAESKLVSDLFLDGLLFAANSISLLEQVWPDLIADKGQILHRLLKRLVHVASFPDWRISGLKDANLAEQYEAWFRIPQPLYWIPVLYVLERHAKDVAKHALIQGSEVCALWLRTMPTGMPGRKEAGALALELAKEAQGLVAEGMHFGDKDKVIYEAVLSAAPEFPDEIAQIALELCGRRDEPEHAIQRGLDEEERQAKRREEWRRNNPEQSRKKRMPVPGISFHREGPLRPPSADGPLRAVSDGFQAAVMDTIALNGLISVRPEVAREVLLAVCIEEPKPYDLHDRSPLRDHLGLADWQRGYPAMYWKGPFLGFLQSAPAQALDAIVRLVNYATTRWIEDGLGRAPTDEERKNNGFEFEFNGKSVCWIGHANVYAWNRYLGMHGDTVECALMALEKWFYDEIESQRSITQWVQYIFDHGTSAAFAGVLVSVGLRYQVLFAMELQPMLGNFYVYQTQMSLAMNESSETWGISYSGQPQEAIKIAADWNRMPHRRHLLRDLAPALMLQHNGTMEYLTAKKAEWAKIPRKSEKSRLDMEFFLARFDPANYTKTPHGDGQVMITMAWPAHLQKIADESQDESKLKMLALTLALRARQLLEGEAELKAEEVPEFAAQVRQLAKWKDSSDKGSQEHYRISSVAGGLAVLFIKHRTWLALNADLEKWCIATLRELKPVKSEHDSPMSINNHGAEAFLGEAGIALLQENEEEWALRLAFEGVTGAHYSSTLFTLWRAYLLREQLGQKFGELVNVMVLWSALRRAAIRDGGYYADDSKLAAYRTTLFRRYRTGKLKRPLIPLRRAETLGRRLVERIERRSMSVGERQQRKALREWNSERDGDRKMHREMPDIDLEVIQKGFGFLATMVRQHRPDEGPLLDQYVRELFYLLMRTLPKPQDGDERSEIQGTPYESDRWIMARAAEFVARTNTVEVARQFYRPILDLGPAAKYWVRDFLQSWIMQGLQVSLDVRGFALIWQDMVAYTETLPAWQPGQKNYWSRAESLATELMGLSETGVAVLGDAKYKDLISSMAVTFEQWGDRWLKYASASAWLAYFLRREAGQVLLPQGIKQLAVTAGSLPDDDWHRHDLGALFTEVLSLCWKHRQKDVQKDASLREAFLRLLTVLCARQIPEALHLRAKVSEILGTS